MVVDAPALGLEVGRRYEHGQATQTGNTPGLINGMELHDNDIHLYFIYPETITDTALLKQYADLLSDAERQQVKRFYFDRHRHQYLLTRALIRTTLSRYYAVEPYEWVFQKNGYDKPGIATPGIHPAIHFNISHADGLIMCGLTRNCDIGVDVEDCQRSTRAAFNRLSSYFSDREINELNALPENARKQRFFDYWTLKEAYIKARGEGLSIPLSSFSFQFDGDKLAGFDIDPHLKDDPGHWQFWRIDMNERHRVALAVNNGNTRFTITAAKAVPLTSLDPLQLNLL